MTRQHGARWHNLSGAGKWVVKGRIFLDFWFIFGFWILERLLGSGPLWGASSREIVLDGGIGVRIRDTLCRKLATLVSGAAKWVVKGRAVSARSRGPTHAPTPDPPAPPDPPGEGGPRGVLGGRGWRGWWVPVAVC